MSEGKKRTPIVFDLAVEENEVNPLDTLDVKDGKKEAGRAGKKPLKEVGKGNKQNGPKKVGQGPKKAGQMARNKPAMHKDMSHLSAFGGGGGGGPDLVVLDDADDEGVAGPRAPSPPAFPAWETVKPSGQPSAKGKKGKKAKKDSSKDGQLPTCLACGVGNHFASACRVFRLMTSAQRWTYVERNNACVKCLRTPVAAHAEGWSCPTCQKAKGEPKCGFNGCAEPHNHLLHFSKEANEPSRMCKACGSSKHNKLTECAEFAGRTVQKRAEVIAMFPDTCVNCLEGDCAPQDCPKAGPCGIDGCQQAHHPLLHGLDGLQGAALFRLTKIASCGACGAMDAHLTYAHCPMFLSMALVRRQELVKVAQDIKRVIRGCVCCKTRFLRS